MSIASSLKIVAPAGSLFSASDGRAFVLADGDWDIADKSESAIFISGITVNDSSHGAFPYRVYSPRRTSRAARRASLRQRSTVSGKRRAVWPHPSLEGHLTV